MLEGDGNLFLLRKAHEHFGPKKLGVAQSIKFHFCICGYFRYTQAFH